MIRVYLGRPSGLAVRRFASGGQYSGTLNLPKTDFPMRANAARREPAAVEACTTTLYREQRAASASSGGAGGEFILHDGPPYANGQLHMGHFLNKVLKDTTNRCVAPQSRARERGAAANVMGCSVLVEGAQQQRRQRQWQRGIAAHRGRMSVEGCMGVRVIGSTYCMTRLWRRLCVSVWGRRKEPSRVLARVSGKVPVVPQPCILARS